MDQKVTDKTEFVAECDAMTHLMINKTHCCTLQPKCTFQWDENASRDVSQNCITPLGKQNSLNSLSLGLARDQDVRLKTMV